MTSNLKDLLRNASDSPKSGPDLPAIRVRARRLLVHRWGARGAATLALIATVAVFGWIVITPENSSSTDPASGVQTQPETEEPSSTVQRNNLTPEVEIGSGVLGDLPYTLRAQVAELTLEGDQMLALCTDWTYGPPPGTGSDCATVDATQLADTLDVAVDESNAETGTVALFGTAPLSTRSIEIELDDGSSLEAEIFGSPPDLNLGLVFFVGSAPVGEAKLVVARGIDEEIVAQKEPPSL